MSPVASRFPSSQALAMPRRSRGSWLDVLLGWLEDAPGPSWLPYLGITCAGSVIVLAVRASLGLLPTTATQLVAVLAQVTFPLAFVGALQLLDGVARRALVTIRPALDADEAAITVLATRLSRTPGPAANAALLLGIAIGVTSVLSGPASYGLAPSSPPYLWAEAIFFGTLATVGALAFVAHAVHQLRVVSEVHRDKVEVELYRLQPLYAFSSLTSWTGIALLAATVYGLAVIELTQTGTGWGLSTVDQATIAVVISVSIASFILPLLGLHGRIVAARQLELAAAFDTLELAIANVRDSIRTEGADHTQAKSGVEAAVASIAAIRAISTWPWRPETLRGFVSAIALPIVIWLIQNAVLRPIVH
jgi:hypothetical protein